MSPRRSQIMLLLVAILVLLLAIWWVFVYFLQLPKTEASRTESVMGVCGSHFSAQQSAAVDLRCALHILQSRVVG